MPENPSAEELVALGEQIAEQAVHLDAAMHRLLADLYRFDEAGGWSAQGFSSCAHWLSHRVGWDLSTSRERIRVARALAALPAVDAALASGKLSYSKARAITRVATPVNAPTLLQYAEVSTASQLETICRKFHAAERLEASPRQALPRDDDRYVVASSTSSGLMCVKAFLLPDEAALLMHAIQQAAKRCRGEGEESAPEAKGSLTVSQAPPEDSVQGRGRSPDVSAEAPAGTTPAGPLQRAAETLRPRLNRADGLMALVQSYVRGDSPARSPIEMIVTTPAEGLLARVAPPRTTAVSHQRTDRDARIGSDPSTAEQATVRPSVADHAVSPAPHDRGTSIPVAIVADSNTYLHPDAARRLACDCAVVEATVDRHGQPLSVGRKTRVIPAAIKRALLLRDRTCRFPGCDHRLFLDGHHLQHWADGGETSLSNLALLCNAHHARVHEHGYRIIASDAGELTFLDSRGAAVVAVPPRPQPAELGWPAIRAANAAHCPGPLSAETSVDPGRHGRLDHQEAVRRLFKLKPRASHADANHDPAHATDPSIDLARPAPPVAAHPIGPPAKAARTWRGMDRPLASLLSDEPRPCDEGFADPSYDFVAAGQRADDLLAWSMEELLATGVDPMAQVPAPIWPPVSWYERHHRIAPAPARGSSSPRRKRDRRSRGSSSKAEADQAACVTLDG